MKNKYLIFREKPYNKGETVAIINVSDLNKYGIKNLWKKYDTIFTTDKYHSSLTETNDYYREFENETKL